MGRGWPGASDPSWGWGWCGYRLFYVGGAALPVIRVSMRCFLEAKTTGGKDNGRQRQREAKTT
jgi:hypothetical protein